MDFQEVISVIFSFVGSLFLVCLAVLLGIYFNFVINETTNIHEN